MHKKIGIAISVVSLSATGFVLYFHADPGLWKVSHSQKVIAIMFGFWLVGPPLYFLTEWSLFNGDKERLEEFKMSHELARNLWVGVSLALGLLLKIKGGLPD